LPIFIAVKRGEVAPAIGAKQVYVERALDTQRVEDLGLHIAIKSLAADALDHGAEQTVIQVRVMKISRTRRVVVIEVRAFRVVNGPGIKKSADGLIGRQHVAISITHGRSMRQEHARGNKRLTPRRAQAETKILGDIGIQVDFPLLDQAHEPQRGDQLGNRSHPEQGVFIHRQRFGRHPP